MNKGPYRTRQWDRLHFVAGDFGSGRGEKREHSRQRSVTDEQRSQEAKVPQESVVYPTVWSVRTFLKNGRRLRARRCGWRGATVAHIRRRFVNRWVMQVPRCFIPSVARQNTRPEGPTVHEPWVAGRKQRSAARLPRGKSIPNFISFADHPSKIARSNEVGRSEMFWDRLQQGL
jgi:hypothetical protein